LTIISASYKTDIPTFYGDWFGERLKAGYVDIRNPFNNRFSRVSLKPDDVDGFVFWTRNISPFLPRLKALQSDGRPFYIQYTITAYPKALESSVPDPGHAVQRVVQLAELYGPEKVVWRYDPILISTLTPESFHLDTFARLSDALAGQVTEVVVSFTQFYRKTNRNLKKLEQQGVVCRDPDLPEKKALLDRLSEVAAGNGQVLTLCSQPDLATDRLAGAVCIDAKRLGLETGPDKGNRPGCLCMASKDIGGYDSCLHGCAYCYAVSDTEKARHVFKQHSPFSNHL